MSPPINLVENSSVVNIRNESNFCLDDDKYLSSSNNLEIKNSKILQENLEDNIEDDMIGLGSLSSTESNTDSINLNSENSNRSESRADTGIGSDLLSNISISPSPTKNSDRNNSISTTSDDMSDFEIGQTEDLNNPNSSNKTNNNTVVYPISSGEDDFNEEETPNRRDTLIFIVKDDSETETDCKNSNSNNGISIQDSSKNIPFECASLSSVYSNYSQFDFISRNAPSPPPQPKDLVFRKSEVHSPSGLSSFLGLFGSKKASTQSNTSNKFDLLTSKFFNFNKSKSDSMKHETNTCLNSDINESLKNSHLTNGSSQDLKVPDSVLIFENRPSNLPAKSQQEELKHRQEYEKMVEMAKKKEQKENELKFKKKQQISKKEDFMANSLKIWNTEIIPHWIEQGSSKRTHQLWWHGLPPSIRGTIWKLAIGNELGITNESYYFYERKAKQKLELLKKYESQDDEKSNESSVELIKLDVSRTFPQLCFFQKDGPYHEALHNVLGAYACYNTQIGYVQGMSFLTAILLLNMEAVDAFICLANLLNTNILMACFCMNQAKMNRYFRVHQILLEYNIPKLYRHFEEQNVKPDLYLIDWIFTLFSKSLPLDVMSRVWDVFFRDKEEFLFRTALGILNLYKDTLQEMDFIHIVQFLTKLPDNINSTLLFKSIEQITTCLDDIPFDNLVNFES